VDEIAVTTMASSSDDSQDAQKIKMGKVDRMSNIKTIQKADPNAIILMAYNTQFLAVKMGRTDVSRDCKISMEIFDSYGNFPMEMQCFNILKKKENMN